MNEQTLDTDTTKAKYNYTQKETDQLFDKIQEQNGRDDENLNKQYNPQGHDFTKPFDDTIKFFADKENPNE